jgi:hypothetical protein
MAMALDYNTAVARGSSPAPRDTKGTAVDSVNANIESLTGRMIALGGMARRISDGLIGVEPERAENAAVDGPRPVSQSTQDHIRDLEHAFDRLAAQINRLG